jgi:hypothetical protein
LHNLASQDILEKSGFRKKKYSLLYALLTKPVALTTGGHLFYEAKMLAADCALL